MMQERHEAVSFSCLRIFSFHISMEAQAVASGLWA